LVGRRTCSGPTGFSQSYLVLTFCPHNKEEGMKTLLIGVAAAGFLAVVTSANAGEEKSSTTAQGSTATQAPADKSSATQTPPSQAGTTASASKELSGVVKKVDKDKRSLKVLSSAGVEQDVKIAPTATITRDGIQAGLEQLKEGDEVRASFDPSSLQATKLEVQSTQMKDKGKSEMKLDTKTDMKTDTKTESKAK
jgi:Cu/Ag efflux protein CusF